ncbi:DNA repair protein RecN [Nitrospira moscoviensis]|uniref:DNA repair protein RecN n=1 Tax=Nitrospira moscoviensis TaxID=42253 RepID=A0A0K2GA97_NITMO|nr:DNA repair protein RecN [Nitrospira moscoviensis]ALA57873.1 DNA repair protein RecN [Nitrospira moscoviensis]
MLTELRLVNFAVLEQLSLSFQPGFTVLTGETGAGKSLLIDAIALLVGGRASTDQIRFGAEEAQLEASFDIPDDHPVLARLRAQDFVGPRDSQLIVRRVIARSGRNRVYLNGNMTPVHVLEAFGGTLVDIHGQHDQQSLLSPSTQLDVLDAFGGLRGLRAEYQDAYGLWKQSCRERIELEEQIRQSRQREDLLRFQQQELAEAALRIGEEEALQAERRRLGASQRLGALAAEALERLQADGHGATPNVAAVERALAELIHIDPTEEETGRLVSEARVLLKEAAGRIRDYAERLETDPGRLSAIEDRLALIHRLTKKYGGTVEAALQAQARVQGELQGIEHADARLEACDKRVDAQRRVMAELAQQLSKKRIEAAKRMTKAVREELDALKMEQTRFSIQVAAAEGEGGYGAEGADRADFLLSANPGEPVKPMARIASGGELSRVMLALKSVLAEVDRVPVLIFDEIDTGVGGAVAAAIGKRLRALGRFHQVFCITHLPQVASQADHHLCVEKSLVKDRAVTTVRPLRGVQREHEIARMLGGETVTAKVRATAAELIAGAND